MDEGVLYISEKFSTAAHNCCCGCGTKIITPLKPGRWTLRKQNGVVSLYPSVGNWSSGCQSHYWIQGNKVKWEGAFTSKQINENREGDHQASQQAHAERRKQEMGFLARLWATFKQWLGFGG
ncbi:DUF6527 family protein [Burkholderia vietnamiensis]|uniref:DUF6527 family protein n=1 Tax=Burkholderia vietnamiensis TaxID=60552 RepID=UPI001ABA8867|nr:DUF6527 family protein [Burkholderia vietnamiensis]